ncbi:LPXTG cell wall anchor domain-containing protein [Paenibacillus sp. 23TSA30-6]|uniref:LPXTG cell wall anchor domain-containing protein n=1 Tax=Paenibacillus sp. 23TSA30-6 TaxID=2546104 RepID=UPI001787F4C3|nr:LPXTG cell wall anchor domain-containing protein [Paenibacillus sp. 23TSA30-6]MBE0338002.1 LPXTG cell wall anchor domain-containing protein [Paenibacillus sp. 23TSA30-6]
MRKKWNVMIIALLLILQSFFGITQAYAQIPAPDQPEIAGSESGQTVTKDVYDIVVPETEPVIAPEQQMPPSLPAPVVQAAATTNSEEAAQASILTKLTLTDATGQVIDAVYNPDSRLDIDDAVHLIYDWELPNNTYKAGDTFTFQLPEQFEIYTDISSPLVTADGNVGHFTVDRQGKVVMTFNDYVESHSNVSGKLEVKTEFSKQIEKGSTEVIIAIPIKGGVQTAVVNIKPAAGSSLDKQGKANGTHQIDWTIDVNKQLDTVQHAVVTDPTPQGLELVRDSIRLYHLQINVDGSTLLRDPVDKDTYTLEADSAGTGFIIRFKDENISSAYRIQYSTNITSEESRFSNTATFSGNNTKDASATATVTVQRGEFLSKKMEQYDPVTQTVSWAIKYNFGEKKIPAGKAVLADRFNKSQQLMAGSLKVYKGATSEELSSSEYTVSLVNNETANGFDLRFNSDVEAAYTIRYQTKAIDRVLKNERITNTVTSDGVTKDTTTELKSGVIVKGFKEPNYNTKTIPWVIAINTDKYTMNQVVINDTFPNGGLALLPDTLKIQSADGKSTLTSPADYELIPLSQDYKQGFTIRFHKTIQDAYTISYSTTFNNEWKKDTSKPDFWNKASISWVQNGTPYSAAAEARLWPDNLTQQNGAKQGSYNATSKHITWDILTNYNRKTLNQAEIKDTLQQGQKLVPGSVKVYDMTLLGWWNGVEKGAELSADQYTLVLPTTDNGNELRIRFNEQINTPYWITFQTTLEGELIDKEINNKALLMDGNNMISEWAAKVTVPHGGEYVTKSGSQNGNKIDWQIRINEGQSYVSNAKIVDTPSSNQILIEDSFHLYSTKVSANGEAAKDTELVKDQDYKLKITTNDQGQQSFELVFTQGISSGYILEYQSFIQADDKAKVSNSVYFEGDRLTTELRETSKEIIVRTSSGSGSGGGITGSLEVTKVDQDHPDKVLSGARFALYDKSQKRAPLIQTTNADGKILFNSLLYDDYILEELAAPAGYKITTSKTAVKIDATVKQSSGIKQIVVTNEKETPVDPGKPTNPGTPTNPGSGKKRDKDPEPTETPIVPVKPVTNEPQIVEDEDVPLGVPVIEQPPVEPDALPKSPEIDPPQESSPPVEIEDEPIPKGGIKFPVEDPEDPSDPGRTPQVNKLPQTGENSPAPFYLSGMSFILLGAYLKYRRMHKNKRIK